MSLSSESSISNTNNPQIFAVGNIFYSLYTQCECQQQDERAFCGLGLKRYTNSFAVVENNSMRFCICPTHI